MDSDFFLKRFYDALIETLILKNKIKDNSVIISFIDMKSNTRLSLLKDSCINSKKIPETILMDLQKKELIRETSEVGMFSITGKGVWKVEEENNQISSKKLIEHVDKKFFDVYSGVKPLNDKEKVLLWGMICARAFSSSSLIDLKKSEYALDSWKRILDKSQNMLSELKIIKCMTNEELYGKKSNEHVVYQLTRHTDALPKKTKALWKAAGNQQYYLAVCQNEDFSKESLEYLIKIIFGEKNKFEIFEINKIIAFCNEISFEETTYLFDTETHIFSSSEYDDLISDALRAVLMV